jgi:DNA-binding transcriptional ArsR family regulator
LPEFYLRLPKTVLVAVRPGSKYTEGLRRPYRGTRRIPAPARPGAPSTVGELAARVGKSPRTVRTHLALLARHGMAVQRDGRWYRLRFDPQSLVSELEIKDTAARKAQEYARQRRGYYDYLCQSHGGRPPAAVRTTTNGRVIYSNLATGAELWSYPAELLDEDTA